MNKEEFRQFRSECGNYFFYLSRLGELMDKKRQLTYYAEGVSASDAGRIISVTRQRTRPRVISLMEVRDETDRQIGEYEEKIAFILNTVNAIPNPSLRPAVWMVFVQNRSFSEVAEIYEMKGSSLKRHVYAQFGQ